jgi:hypothetical protein
MQRGSYHNDFASKASRVYLTAISFTLFKEAYARLLQQTAVATENFQPDEGAH